MQFLEQIQPTVAGIAERVGPAVVGLRGSRRAVGSGVVITQDTVLTVVHALGGAATVDAAFSDGRRAEGRVVGHDPDLGVAVVHVETGAVAPFDLAAAGPAPGLGAPVFALADPGGRGLRITFGLVTVAEASFRGSRGRRIAGAIEHSAPLPRGSSGGPLVDLDGRLLGLNAVRRHGGLILAVPADDALRERVAGLVRGEAVAPRRLGVAVAPPALARRMRRAVGLPEREGLLVHAVEDVSPAARAGLQRGDLLVAAQGHDLAAGTEQLYAALDALETGGALTLSVVRGTDERDVVVDFAAAAEAVGA